MERIAYQDIPVGMFEKLMAIENFLHNSPLEMHLLELIRLRVAQLNECAYCVDMHYKELQHLGETDIRLSSLSVWKEAPYFSEKEKSVLKFTEVLTKLNEEGVPEEVYNSLNSFFNKQEICFITMAVSQINTWTRLMRTFRFVPGNYQVKKSNTDAPLVERQ